ncbi:MAG: OmpA family protein [Bacteroidales bacterium]|nr:OmpA family protein [Bacteroidales bacterium]
MQKKILIFFIIYISSVFTINIYAQQTKADRYYDNLAYSKAIKYYKRAYKKDIENIVIVRRLAESYRLTNNMEEAEIWYAKLVNFPDVNHIDIYHYAQLLKSIRDYEEALIWIDKYYRLTGNEWAKRHLTDMNYHIRLSKNSQSYQIINLATNSEEADFGPSYYKDYIIFASSRKSEESTDYVYAWDENPYLELYESEIRDNGELFNTQVLTTNKKSNYHEGPASYSSTENVIYFTRNNWTTTVDTSKENTLNIFKATVEDGEWVNVESLSFNSDEYSCGHPTITSDGNRLYFISNKPDGFGGTDIYYSDKNGEDWSEPVNVGYNINTIGNEMFPFIHENGTLYFASDGHLGLGGLDIFAAYKDTLEVYNVENLAAPINSSRDDFGYIVDKDEMKGYFSSNRPGGQGDDDIYWFKREKLKLIGSVKDILDERLLGEVEVILANSEGVKLDSYITTEIGEYEFKIAYDKDYKLMVEKEGFAKYELDIGETEKNTYSIVESDIFLVSEKLAFTLNEPVRLNDIYYDLNSYNLRPGSFKELDELVKILRRNPEIIIEICSHTDSRANDVYNYWLSQHRAISVADYIISQGIDQSRIQGKGYGETHILNHCINGVFCSEYNHQENRRTEFKVIGYVESSGLNLHADNIKNEEDEDNDNIPEFLSSYLDGDHSVIQDRHGALNSFYANYSRNKSNSIAKNILKYSIVAASYKKIYMAQEYADKLNSKGYDSKVVFINGFYRVTINSAESFEEASISLNIAKKELNKDVWIMKHF